MRGKVLGQKVQHEFPYMSWRSAYKSLFCVSKLKTLRNMVGGKICNCEDPSAKALILLMVLGTKIRKLLPEIDEEVVFAHVS